MKRIVTGRNWLFGPWVCERAGAGDWILGRGECIGLVEDGQILAVILFEAYNGVSMSAHFAAVPGKRWLTREYLWFVFNYAFNHCRCLSLLTTVPASNKEAIAFDEHIGWTYKVTLEDAHPDGDLLLYQMRKQDCRWLNIRSRHNVLGNRTQPAPNQV